MPEEVRFFIRTALFGAALAAAYWFVSHEWIGTIVLSGFGAAGAFLAIVLGRAARRSGRTRSGRPWTWIGLDEVPGQPLGSEPERLPEPSATPLLAAAGAALAALTLAYGPVFVVVAMPLLAIGVSRWVAAASREWSAVERDEPG